MLYSLIAFVFVLGVLVFVHEFGHYLAARWCGIRVDTFSVGFGPKLFTWRDRSGTAWCISAVPLGGYVKPHGFEDPETATPEQKASWVKGETFHEKGVGSRALVIAMGPIFNFILAFMLYVAILCIYGQPHLSEKVSQVLPEGAAARAGLMVGDEIVAIGSLKVINVSDIRAETARRADEETTIQVRRGGENIILPVKIGRNPAVKDVSKAGMLGITFNVTPGRPLRLDHALPAAARQTWNVTVQTLRGVVQMLTGQRSPKDLGGAIRIAQLSGEVAHLGIGSLFGFMAVLSINLGLINLFPIPLLDGGRLIFYVAEAVFRRPVSKTVQQYAYYAGFTLIATLFIFSTFNDLVNIGVFRWFRGA